MTRTGPGQAVQCLSPLVYTLSVSNISVVTADVQSSTTLANSLTGTLGRGPWQCVLSGLVQVRSRFLHGLWNFIVIFVFERLNDAGLGTFSHVGPSPYIYWLSAKSYCSLLFAFTLNVLTFSFSCKPSAASPRAEIFKVGSVFLIDYGTCSAIFNMVSAANEQRKLLRDLGACVQLPFYMCIPFTLDTKIAPQCLHFYLWADFTA